MPAFFSPDSSELNKLTKGIFLMKTNSIGRGLALAALLAGGASAHAAQTLNNLPSPVNFTLAGTGLPDGRFALYNGNDVYYQAAVDTDAFNTVAANYAGDPSFIAISPSGTKLLLGAGGFGIEPYLNDLYLVDAASPQDFAPTAIVANRPHYAAVFLTEDLVLIDSGDFIDSELAILDLNAKSGAPVTVLRKPSAGKQAVVDPKPGYSSNLAFDPTTGRVFAMDAASRELRYFQASDLINAFNGSTLLDWANDGTLVGAPGDYAGGGAAGVTSQGYVVLGGSLGFTGPGMVQVVNPVTGEVVKELDPANDDGYTQVIMNSFTGDAIVLQSGSAFLLDAQELISVQMPVGMPVAGAPALLALAVALTMLARRKS
ncbi:MAG: hypothetical protein RLZZ303_2868 [Candidatus Hydrogenedentota bacterium]